MRARGYRDPVAELGSWRRRGLWLVLAWGINSPPLQAARQHSAKIDRAHFACSKGETLDVRFKGTTAIVQHHGRTYSLVSRPSSLGKRFSSATATLIIDGSFAAFVAHDAFGLDDCQLASESDRLTSPKI